MRLLSTLMPQERKFFALFNQHASLVVQGAAALVEMLSADAVAYADGGGKFAAARRPIVGSERVARFVASVVAKWRGVGELRVSAVNGGVGLLHYVDGALRAVMTVATGDARVDRVFIVVNPDKVRPAPRE